jgi:hypothetical protein
MEEENYEFRSWGEKTKIKIPTEKNHVKEFQVSIQIGSKSSGTLET